MVRAPINTTNAVKRYHFHSFHRALFSLLQNYDIEASNLVTDRMSSANTVTVPAKFSSGTFH
ncbi:hypothetical protein BDR06DRAFT_950764 [Suillus hirtellus]|nr:hypothetical protein BDR06DRAFT_950764 [Suillus hirtellus]